MAGNNSQNSRVARNHKKPRSPKRHWIKKILLALLALFVIGLLSGTALFFYYAKDSGTVTESDLKAENATKIYDANNELVTTLGASNRKYVTSSQIPSTLKKAVVSIEDRRFYKHKGVDYYRIIGAALGNIKGSSLGMQGGSTLTMQLIKLSKFSTKASDRTLRVKAQEAWLALNVEKHYTKSQILEFYINKVYMGNGIYGMGTAAHYYYNKSLKDLNLSQLALLAGMPQSPTYYDPTSYPKYAESRRNTVLQAMYDNKEITKAQQTAAENVGIKSGLTSAGHAQLNSQHKNAKVADAYIKEVLTDLESKGYDPYKYSLKVYTNLNMNAQRRLYDIANTSKYVTYPNNRFQLGVSVVNSYTGKISAMIGGRKHTNTTYGFNRAVRKDRSNASTMKPILDYGPAIEYNNWPTYKTVEDTKYNYPGTDNAVNDFDNKTLGSMTMREALVQSRNIPAVKTLETVGLSRAKTFANSLGMGLKKVYYANAIGAEVSSLQVAGAYAAFANGGTYHKPYYISKITAQDGTTTNYDSKGTRVMKQSTAYMITDMLKGVINSASGTGTTARISGVYQAGKTGTDGYDSRYKHRVPSGADVDSWMAGYTKNYSVSVWTGYDNPNDFSQVNYIDSSTAKISQNIYREMMTYLQEHAPNSDWTKPSSVATTTRNGIQELYLVGHVFSDATSSSQSSSTASSHSTTSHSQATSASSSEESSEASSSSESSKEASSSSEESESSSSHEESSSEEHSSSSEAVSSSHESSSTAPAEDQQDNQD